MTEELKALLKAAKTEEEAKEILLAHKSELSDEELEKTDGGILPPSPPTITAHTSRTYDCF